MAKLGSSSCRPLGTVLLALLLLASIQAGPVMAWEQVVADLGEKLLDHGAEKARDLAINKGLTEWGKKKGSKDGSDGMKAGYRTGKYVRKAHGWKDKQNPGGAIGTPYVVDTIATSNGLRLKLVTADITATPAAKTGFCATAVAGGTQLISMLGSRPGSEGGGSVVLGGPLRGTLQYCTAVGGPAGAVLGLGRGGDLSRSFPTFSYYVTSRGNTVVWFPQPQVPAAAGTGASITLVPSRYPNDGRYYVRMTGIRVVGLGQELVVQTPTGLNLPPPAYLYLSTTQRNTYIESNLYGRLRAAVIRQMNALSPGATPTSSPLTADKLCYAAAALSAPLRLPRIAILLASNNAARETMELGGAAWDTEPSISMFCLGILPATTEEPVLGSMIQSGRTMTIDLTAAGRLGTLTF